jgi:hypothetical protein
MGEGCQIIDQHILNELFSGFHDNSIRVLDNNSETLKFFVIFIIPA